MLKTVFKIPAMDCGSEENLIRLRLQGLPGIRSLEFNLYDRVLTVTHSQPISEMTRMLSEISMKGSVLSSGDVEEIESAGANGHSGNSDASGKDGSAPESELDGRNALFAALAINLAFFFGEAIAGWLSGSMGLVADSLDMLADALIYGLSFWALSGSMTRKKSTARVSGYLQLALAFAGLLEVMRRFQAPEELPEFRTMILFSLLALTANAATMAILSRSRNQDVNLKASMIFTSNDILVNVMVIVSGILVWLTDTRLPDLMVGGLVFVVVAIGSKKILALAK